MNTFLKDLLNGSNSPCSGNIEITFDYHQRYENNIAVMGEQEYKRILRIEKNISGNIGYTISINPSMSPKPMKIISVENNYIHLQGYGYDRNAVMLGIPIEVANFSYYGITLLTKGGQIEECILYLLDRNIDIEYYNKRHHDL